MRAFRMMFTIRRIEVMLLLSAGLIGILWMIYPSWPYWEPMLVVVNVIAIGMIHYTNWRLDKAEYSPALALALGYVNNYLEPLIMGLLKKHPEFTFYIYIPKELNELSMDNIERIKSTLETKRFKVDNIKVDTGLRVGMRSCLEVRSVENGESFYFDFPTTLRALEEYIDYKIGSKNNQSAKKERNQLGNKLIDQFHQTMSELLSEKQIDQYIKIVGKELEFNEPD